MTDKEELDVEHLTWLVEGRAETQRVSVKLLGLVRALKNTGETHLQVQSQRLAAIAFSLWRAAFLSDQDAKHGLVQCESFLEKLIVDNAINYPQDRAARAWSWGYYMHTAAHHLDHLESNVWPGVMRGKAKSDEPRERWDFLQKAFSKAVDRLDADVKALSKKKPS